MLLWLVMGSNALAGAITLSLKDAAKAKPGLKGNLIVKASGERSLAEGTQPPPENRRRIPLGALPAIPFEIVPQ